MTPVAPRNLIDNAIKGKPDKLASCLEVVMFGNGCYFLENEKQVKTAYEPSGPSGRSLSRFL